MAKKSDYSLFINFFFNSLKNRIIHYFLGSHYSIFIIFLAHFSLFIIEKGHYSLIIIPHLDPHVSGSVNVSLEAELGQILLLGLDVHHLPNFLGLKMDVIALFCLQSFEECQKIMVERGNLFLKKLAVSRQKIAKLAHRFISDGSVSCFYTYF